MLYFRFDINKEDFKGTEHKSVLFGDGAEEMAILRFEDGSVDSYYLNQYDELQEKLFDELSEEEYDEKFSELLKEYIDDEWTLNGCSCFELSEEGIEEARNYGHIYDREIVTIFEGNFVSCGHDGECVSKCNDIKFQGNSKKFVDILFDIDLTNQEKITKINEIFKEQNEKK